jgi:hypothetical protein
VAGRAAALGLLKGDDTSVQRYVTARALDGLFLMIGEEEKKLRADPLRAGSALLAKVFGGPRSLKRGALSLTRGATTRRSARAAAIR